MTPAILAVKKANIRFQIHSYKHQSDAGSYGLEAAEALGLDPSRVFKTLIVSLNGKPTDLAVAVVPVSSQLSLKKMAASCQAKKATMADPKEAERATGYILGGISPLGQKKRLSVVIDESALLFDTIFVSAAKRGLEIELSPQDLTELCSAQLACIAMQ